MAFLPGSQVDIRPVRDIGPLINKPEPFLILKMDRRRGNIVVSRRAVLEESRAEQRNELLSTLQEGQILEGVVKNITDYGAFVDLGGLDGLLHVTDISWKRVNHPSDVLHVGQTVRVQVIRFNRETQRISLGMKQLEADPWEGVELKYPVGAKFTGRVTNITDYGAFVELEPGVEGLVHVSEMSWTKKNVHPGKIVSTSQEVEVMVLEVDPEKRRISLGLKQTIQNPWEAFVEQHALGSEVDGEIKNITEFGLFVGLDNDIDGMVHLSDIEWEVPGEEAVKRYSKGDTVRAQVLDVDVEKERISLGIKQLGARPLQGGDRGPQARCPRHLHGPGEQLLRDRGRDRRRCLGLHPQVRAVARPRGAAARALRQGREDRRQGDERRCRQPAAGALGQGPGDRRREAGHGRVRLLRQRRQPGRHPGCGHPAEAGGGFQGKLSRSQPQALSAGRVLSGARPVRLTVGGPFGRFTPQGLAPTEPPRVASAGRA